jgi:hypothetical protein
MTTKDWSTMSDVELQNSMNGPWDKRFAQAELQRRSAAKAPTATSSPATSAAPAGGAGPGYGDVSGLFREALAGLTGETEKMYQQGKRRTLSDIAMQSVNSGMANTLNMPAAGIAYDEANRAQTNLGLASKRADILTGLGQTAAGMYGVNVGAETSRYGTDVGARTSLSNTGTTAGVDYAQQALQRYIAQLQNTTANRELTLKSGDQGGFASSGMIPR